MQTEILPVNPAGHPQSAAVPGGARICHSCAAGDGLSQVLTATLQAAATYTLTDDGAGTIYLTGLSKAGGPADPYGSWATGGELFGDDANGDGVSNGLAFLLGAANPNANALGLLPTVTETSGGLVMSFSMRGAASRGTATLNVEHSSDLGIADAWTTVAVPDTSGGPTDGVTFEVSGSEMLEVRATIGSDQASGGKLFGRLKAAE